MVAKLQKLDWFLEAKQPSDAQSLKLVDINDLSELMGIASDLRDKGFGRHISYSRKVFIPLTQLCRDVCHYCTFAQPPRNLADAFLKPDQVLKIATAGKEAGCKEALFTLGDKPELRYSTARNELSKLGFQTTLEYLRAMALMVFEETGLLPHLNPGILDAKDITSLREVSVSMGIMLESSSDRLMEKGNCHHGSPDKAPGRAHRSRPWSLDTNLRGHKARSRPAGRWDSGRNRPATCSG